MTLNDLLGNDDAPWMSDPRRSCAIDPNYEPSEIRDQADGWFPSERYEQQAATRLCGDCPSDIKVACLTYALDNNEEWGIWGGLTAGQRQSLNRDHRAKAAAIREAAA